MIGVKGNAWLGLAELIGSLMHHEYLLFTADSRQVPIITNPYQQPATIRIGKSRDGFGKFASVGHTILEVLLLMLTFANETKKVSFVVHSFLLDSKLCERRRL